MQSMTATDGTFWGERGDSVCRRAWWGDVVKFFLLNYGLHALTVLTPPGSGTFIRVRNVAWALIHPICGIITALEIIFHCPILKKDRLERARKAGALCMMLLEDKSRESQWIDPYFFSIHGQCPIQPNDTLLQGFKRWINLKTGKSGIPNPLTINGPKYGYIRVPTKMKVTPYLKDDEASTWGITGTEISCNYSVVKPLAAIAQICYGSFELFYARNSQLSHFGYAAYSLTIIPYIVMSFLNLVASLCQPDYPCLYLVNSAEEPELQGPAAETTGADQQRDPERQNGDTHTPSRDGSQDAATAAPNPKLPKPATPAPTNQEKSQEPRTGSANRERSNTTDVSSPGGVQDIPENTHKPGPPQDPSVYRKLTSCAVGVAHPRPSSSPESQTPQSRSAVKVLVSCMQNLVVVIVIAVPYLVILWLTGFDAGGSTAEQRGWTMASLVAGHFSFILFMVAESYLSFRSSKDVTAGVKEGIWEGNWGGIPRLVPSERLPPYAIPLYLFLMSFPAIGASVMVVRMIFDSDICVTI